MKVLVLGGSGFIGQAVVQKLQAAGHEVLAPKRQAIDFAALSTAAEALFEGVEAVVNCVGVMSRSAAKLEQIHHYTPLQLAHWAKAAGAKRWIQLSALGADAAQPIAFVGSKGRGDAAIVASGIHTLIARPSLVYGRGGASTELFIKLAALPMMLLPEAGKFHLQPVHVQEVAEGLVAMLTADLPTGSVIDMTGAEVITLAQYLHILRQKHYHKAAAKIINLPLAVLKPFLPLTNILSNGFLSQGNMDLLRQGSCADNQGFAALLGRMPLGAKEFI